ncbi:MAG: diacylglycerol kinase family lipid kinase [Chloroflexi bacterium]|nr:MAG: diacylglycerol kinase family lipid kinase [Chloroflexota bacterium]
MRTKIILNPWSDRGRAVEKKEEILRVARMYGEVDLVLTERRGHARELARQAADEGYELVAAAGGDGTVHEVVNGLVQGGRADVLLGVIPVGSGNDFAYAFGIEPKVETAVPRLFTGQPHTVDLARIEDEHGRFEIVDNNIGIGFDAMIAIQTQSITRVHGFVMYTLATLRTIALYYQTPHLEIWFDDEKVAQESLFLAFGLGPRGGGGFFLTPDARHDDGLIDTCLVNPVGRLTMLYMMLKVMRGTHVTSRHVTMRQNQQIMVSANMPLPIHTDGEIFAYPEDNVRRVTVTSLPAAIQVMA